MKSTLPVLNWLWIARGASSCNAILISAPVIMSFWKTDYDDGRPREDSRASPLVLSELRRLRAFRIYFNVAVLRVELLCLKLYLLELKSSSHIWAFAYELFLVLIIYVWKNKFAKLFFFLIIFFCYFQDTLLCLYTCLFSQCLYLHTPTYTRTFIWVDA